MTLNDTAARFLQACADGGEPEGGWLHANALRQVRLDFTPDSLPRLDHLLAQVRERAAPTAAQRASEAGRNFLSLIAFYIVEIARRRTGADVQWLDREAALRVLPPGTQVPEGSITRMLALVADQGAAFWPLNWVETQLLPGGEVVPAARYVDNLVQQIEREAPVAWWQALEAVGRMASWQMLWVHRGRPAAPTMLASRLPTTWDVIASDEVSASGVPRSIELASQRLEQNPQGERWQVLCYDAFIDHEGARTDALVIVAYTYGPRPLRLRLAFPYRPARDGHPFAILRGVIHEANVEGEKLARLQGAMDRGIQKVRWPGPDTWDSLRRD